MSRPEPPGADAPDAVALAHVLASARFLGLPLDPERAARVATHLARTREMVAALQALPLEDDLEPAALFCPAPFPAGPAP